MQFGKGIPVRISPFFFVTAGLIGFLQSGGSLSQIFIWIAIIFVSILVHEYGHALTSLAFGQRPRIELVAFGGLTIPSGPRLSKGKEFLVVLAGPLFGLALFFLALFAMRAVPASQPVWKVVFYWTAAINLFWTIVNLFPILPLDGGQLVRIILEAIFGQRGLIGALMCSAILATIAAVSSLIFGLIIPAVLFFLFAFQNFETYRRSRHMTQSDNKEEYQAELKQIEQLLMENRLEDALPTLESLRAKTKQGLLYNLCTQYLAQIQYRHRDLKKVYELLQPIYKDISPLELVMLQDAASEMGDHKLVSNISGECYQMVPSPEIALRAAKAAAAQHEEEATVGWLSAARDQGVENVDEFIADPAFDPVRNEKRFTHFTETLKKAE